MWFEGWMPLLRVVAVGASAYAALVVLLRVSGKRTLSKLSAFDLVVTVALGSTLATVLLSKDVSLAEGIAALALLVAMQFVVTWSAVRSARIRSFVNGEPTLLAYRGRLLPLQLKRERITEDDVRAALRNAGYGTIADVEAIVLETDGTIDVVRRVADSAHDALLGVTPPPDRYSPEKVGAPPVSR